MLERDNFHVAGVQEIGGTLVRIQFLLVNLEANDFGISVTSLDVIDRDRDGSAFRLARSLQQVGCERGNAVLTWQIVVPKRGGSNA